LNAHLIITQKGFLNRTQSNDRGRRRKRVAGGAGGRGPVAQLLSSYNSNSHQVFDLIYEVLLHRYLQESTSVEI
jgi:hypothetical protein